MNIGTFVPSLLLYHTYTPTIHYQQLLAKLAAPSKITHLLNLKIVCLQPLYMGHPVHAPPLFLILLREIISGDLSGGGEADERSEEPGLISAGGDADGADEVCGDAGELFAG